MNKSSNGGIIVSDLYEKPKYTDEQLQKLKKYIKKEKLKGL